MGLADRIIGVESGGNATAKNPHSSATGAGQFIDSTWLDMVRRYHPDLAGGSREQVLALRNDPGLSREMVERYSDENGAKLRAAGLPDNDGTRYLSHFAGPAGAASVLRADPTTPVSQVLPASSIAANGFLQGKSAGWLADWAARKVGADAPAMTMPDAKPADGRFGFSGIEAAPAAPASSSASKPAKDDGADVAGILKTLLGSGADLAKGAQAEQPAAPPMRLTPPQRTVQPFDAQRFFAQLAR